MKTQLIRIEIKIAVLLFILLLIGIFVNRDPMVLIVISSFFSTFIICDYRDYQESDEFINSLYK